MSDGENDFHVTVDFHGIELGADDFPPTVRGWVACEIANALNVHCRDKEAALDLLDHAAGVIIEGVLTNAARQFLKAQKPRRGGVPPG